MVMEKSVIENTQSDWKILYKIGGIAALMTVLVGVVESSINMLPDSSSADMATVVDWFTLLQDNPFMGLRNLGLLNMFFNAFAVPLYFALYAAHRKVDRVYAALAMVIAFIGVAVFFATNRAFPMLDLSNQYAAATSDVRQAPLVAAGQAMLSVGQSHTPGTFFAFFFAGVAGLTMSIVMLRGNVFGKVNAYAGVLGFALLIVFEIGTSFVWDLDSAAMLLAMLGGLFSAIWDILLACRLFQLARDGSIEMTKV
jgi:hypothetical protein